jgi:hypothetical protein
VGVVVVVGVVVGWVLLLLLLLLVLLWLLWWLLLLCVFGGMLGHSVAILGYRKHGVVVEVVVAHLVSSLN